MERQKTGIEMAQEFVERNGPAQPHTVRPGRPKKILDKIDNRSWTKDPHRARPGRPRELEGTPKSIMIRVTEGMYDRIHFQAQQEGRSMSNLVNRVLRDAYPGTL